MSDLNVPRVRLEWPCRQIAVTPYGSCPMCQAPGNDPQQMAHRRQVLAAITRQSAQHKTRAQDGRWAS